MTTNCTTGRRLSVCELSLLHWESSIHLTISTIKQRCCIRVWRIGRASAIMGHLVLLMSVDDKDHLPIIGLSASLPPSSHKKIFNNSYQWLEPYTSHVFVWTFLNVYMTNVFIQMQIIEFICRYYIKSLGYKLKPVYFATDVMSLFWFAYYEL